MAGGDVSIRRRTCGNDRARTNLHSRKHNSISADCNIVPDDDGKRDRTENVAVKTYFVASRPNVVADSDIRADETIVTEFETRPHRDTSANDAAVPEHGAIEVHERPDFAIRAQNSTANDISKLRYSCSCTDCRVLHIRSRIDNRSRMDAQTKPLFAHSWT